MKNVPIFPPEPPTQPNIQPKLTIGQPNDKYEQEAENVATEVVNHINTPPSTSNIDHPIQTQRKRNPTHQTFDREVVGISVKRKVSTPTFQKNQNLPDIGQQNIQTKRNPTHQTFDREVVGMRVDRRVNKPTFQENQNLPDIGQQNIQTKRNPTHQTFDREVVGIRVDRKVNKPTFQENKNIPDIEQQNIQRESENTQTSNNHNIEDSIQSKKGSGQEIAADVREPMEQAFGANFTSVRVHTDGESDQLNQSLNAKAFATGQDVFFRQGAYNPTSRDGQHLLAHELTHVVQQNGNTVQPKSLTKIARKENKDNNNNSQKIAETENKQSAEITPKTAKSSPVNTPQQPATQPNNSPAPETAKNQNQQVGIQEKENKPQNNQKQVTSAAGTTGNTGNSSGANSGNSNSNTTTNTGEKAPTSPQQDPAFQEVVNKAKGVGTKSKEHEPAATKSKEAQDAAQSPEAELKGKAQDQKVAELEGQQPGTFNATAFKNQLLNKIKEITPKTEDEAKEFKNNNKIDQVKNEVSSQVKDEKENAANPIEDKVKEQPDTSSVTPKEVKPLAAPQPGQPTTDIGSKNAAPKPKTNSEVSAPLQQNSQEIDQKMAEAKITDEQLAKSNEPQFLTTLEAKKEAKTHSATAPQEYRQKEQGVINKAEGEAQNLSQTGLQGMHGEKENILTQVIGKQEETKGQDEGKRGEIGTHINGIYENTKTEVDKCLSDLETNVNSKFDNASNAAKTAFENYVGQKMDAYKQERYGEWYDVSGWGNRASDFFTGLPPEVNKFFEDGRELYINEMDTALTEIANLVADKLNEAKQKIADGKQKIQEYVTSLPENLQEIGKEAAENIQSKFDELAQSVDNKQNELIDSLANKYQENLQAVDAKIQEMKEANKGFLTKAKEGIQGVWETIQKIKEMFMTTLAKVASVIDKILSDPIEFLGNLINGVKQGFNNFTTNIVTHLQTGLITWLTGALGGMGLQLPEDIFSLPGILSLVMQVLGLNWGYIRGKGVKLLGEPVVGAMEQGSELFPMLMNGDYVGMWEHLKEDFNDLKESVIEQIKEMVITQVITAGVKWIIGLLNPASAFVKAAMAIYDIVMFFINRGSQIMDLVNAITDAIAAIANGAIDGAAKLVENALAKSLPVVIGFLASLLGIGDLAKKVQDIIGKIRQRIDQAIDKLLLKAKKLFKGAVKKGKEKVAAITEWWKAKKKFKAQDGENHTLFFNGENNSAKLMIASTPKVLDSYLADLKAKNAKISDDNIKNDNNKKLQSIEVSASKIDKLKSDKSIGKGVGEEISTELASIASNLASIELLDEGVPPSQIKWTTQGEDGKSMIAEPLSLDPGGFQGSEPYDESALWKKVSVRNNSTTTIYIRGHLLNHHVHGPGSKQNLTPITGALNSKMEREVESTVKNKVLGEKKVVSYHVEVDYGGHSSRTNIPDEAKLAKSMKFQLHEMKAEPGKDPKQQSSWKKANPISITPSMNHDLPPDLSVGKLPSVDFGNAPVSDVVKNITAIEGIGEKPARAIGDLIENNRKRGRNDIEEKELMHVVPGLGKTKLDKIKKQKFT
ncbi:DUF4157 domain-containing protein [Anabaena sp. UHCC 0204]|uniref:eCIS core domain-containing protein n=1 Tax=Anabaena sp. UHCC 0204 TaxID=2590009 RepID=UPI0014477677|nr:DUF4157 domain-containing protein [Anabaena sp. UHCC 0204]MTJ09806.1 DUF4157 domain-containing protein [Anabaena sp. UHCC 0204]